MTEENTYTTERKFRVSMKQSAKGSWSAEFTVRADSYQELGLIFEQTKDYVHEQLKLMNFRSEAFKDLGDQE